MQVKTAFFSSILSVMLSTTVAATLQVGKNKTYKVPSAAAAIAKNGDTIEIDAGEYLGDVATWNQNDLTLRGVGGMAHLKAEGKHAGGKGIWVFYGKNITVEHIEFSGCRVPDLNGAGIRFQGTNLTVRHCSFHDNENGILGGGGPESEVLIEYSEFNHNGLGSAGYTHNMYISKIKKFTIQYSFSHHTVIGHNLKSRAEENHILYNAIRDESDGNGSRSIDLPDGGRSFIIGNALQQGPNSDNSTLIGYAAESKSNTVQELYAVNNTLVNDRSAGTFITGIPPVHVIANNLYVGPGSTPPENGSTIHHNLKIDGAQLADRTRYDYHLKAGSDAVNAGASIPNVAGISLTPVFQYVHTFNSEPRPVQQALDIGAYEYSTMTVLTHISVSTAACSLFQNAPNPFSEFTEFIFLLQEPGPVTLNIRDLKGTLLTTIKRDISEAGMHSIPFRISPSDTSPFKSGTYIYELKAGVYSQRRKMTVLIPNK